MSTSTTCYTLLKPRLAKLTRSLGHLKQGELASVHPTRVAARRLRELLPVLHLDPDSAKKMNSRLKKIVRRLGKLRDAEVALALIDRLVESEKAVRHALPKVRDSLRERQKKVRLKDAIAKSEADGRRIVKKLERIQARKKDETPDAEKKRAVLWVIKARVVRRALVLRHTVEEAGSVYLPERLHTTRIATRRLRYAVELLSEVDGAHTSELRVFERVQEHLGRLHDVQTLIARIRRMQGALVPADLKAWQELDTLNVLLENKGRRLHASYMHHRAALLHVCERLAGRAAATTGAAKRKAS